MQDPTDHRATPLWAHVHALTVLADTGSFTAAAQRLACSKAAMSQRVAELERAAGVPLVQRTTRSVRLTEAGLQLVERSRAAFETIDDALAGVRNLAAAPRGLVRLTAPVALARQQLLPRLPDFLRQHPQVRLELDLSDRLVSLAKEGFDLALRHTSHPPDTHVGVPLCDTRSWVVASPGYLARQGLPRRPEDLSTLDCLFYPRPGEQALWSFEPATGGARLSVPVHGPFAANNSEALREMALAGLGLALLPDFSLQPWLGRGELVAVLPDWRSVGTFGTQLWVLRPHTSQVPLAVQALTAWLRRQFSAGFGT
ncbi:LysR family transcriptional regulator [Ideonella livida]|uniref:LysR family transcriptional regulator n=1 Tax=Ideonella livida TaxID=2707176 RepID=A0A7C9TL27_9BURK|nr:LysR family transcriptional regulator [Ideonella livida]NDY92938.1 LysR family transcriptional regulator [Ideonella livida]